MLRDRVEGVRNSVRGPAEADGDTLGVVQGGRSQFFDFLRESSRKKHGLPFGGDVLENALYVRQEAHVEHAVGLIQDKDFNIVQVGMALLDMIEQAARAGHQDFDPVA